jgi:hypothetical protein
MKIGYAKVGRSMPLSLAKCGNLGGDVEMAAVVGELARRRPQDTFVLVGRNTGEYPGDVGLPSNVTNPWQEWGPTLRRQLNDAGLNHPDLSSLEQVKLREIFAKLTLPTFMEMDAFIIWVGQHGTSNTPIPRVNDRLSLTKPQDFCAYYCSFIFQGVNAWRDVDPLHREEIYLNADPRNEHKMRDLKWPLRHPVLAQFDHVKKLKHERYGDARNPHAITDDDGWHWGKIADAAPECDVRVSSDVWVSAVRSVYSQLEVNSLVPGTAFGDLIKFNDDPMGRAHFGIIINEARAIGVRPDLSRKVIARDWVLPLEPAFIHGTWSKASARELGIEDVVPVRWHDYYPKLHSVRCTLTTPSSGSGWATTKPWEAFAGGTVCFFHPNYDTQDHILGDAHPDLCAWLRVNSRHQFFDRVRRLETDNETWRHLVHLQREHFERAVSDLRYVKMIEERLDS